MSQSAKAVIERVYNAGFDAEAEGGPKYTIHVQAYVVDVQTIPSPERVSLSVEINTETFHTSQGGWRDLLATAITNKAFDVYDLAVTHVVFPDFHVQEVVL